MVMFLPFLLQSLKPRRLAKHDTLRTHSLPLAPMVYRGRLDCNTNNYKERKLIMKLDMNKPHYLCSWDETLEVHTRETLYDQYKDTNLYNNDATNDWFFDHWQEELSFEQILDKFDALYDVGEWHINKDNSKQVRNDNMIIQRIW